MKKILMAVAFSPVLMLAAQKNIIIPSQNTSPEITIYNKSLAFVHDKRIVNIEKGSLKLIYQGIPKSVIPESVIPTFKGVGVSMYSQNYIYNLVSPQSMLKYSIDRQVEYYKNNATQIENPEMFSGTLISSTPAMIKDSKTGKIITVNNANQIVFSSIPEEMITKPSLVWKVEAEKYGDLEIDLKYLTTGISWKSDYVLDLSNKTLDVNGWITINNNSGVSYSNATITCLAGEINRKSPQRERSMIMKKGGMSNHVSSMDVQEEAFSGYHIYKIPFKETIENKQQKQIIFIKKKGVSYAQYGYGVNNYFENYGEQNMVFQNVIEFKNSKKNKLGIPLPAGTVRMYKKDMKGDTHFIGQDRIKNTPNKEKVKLTIGTMFDVVGTKTVTKFKQSKYHKDIETTYEVRNRGKEPVEVRISENIPTYGKKIETLISCKNKCSFVEKSAFRREYTIQLKGESSYKFTTEFSIEK